MFGDILSKSLAGYTPAVAQQSGQPANDPYQAFQDYLTSRQRKQDSEAQATGTSAGKAIERAQAGAVGTKAPLTIQQPVTMGYQPSNTNLTVQPIDPTMRLY